MFFLTMVFIWQYSLPHRNSKKKFFYIVNICFIILIYGESNMLYPYNFNDIFSISLKKYKCCDKTWDIMLYNILF